MGWSIGENNEGRDIGYGVPSTCDHPGCDEKIDRGLSYLCGHMPDGDGGCGLYFCEKHRIYSERRGCSVCKRCYHGNRQFEPKADVPEWIHHKATDPSWAVWRDSQMQRSGDGK